MRSLPAVSGLILAITFHCCIAAVPEEAETFKTTAAKEATRLRGMTEYQRAGCGLNALIARNVILRSGEPLLRSGDRVLAVNGRAIDEEPGAAFKVINSHSTGDIVHLKLLRAGSMRTVGIACKNAAVLLGYRLTAVEAAAAGHFEECADTVSDYERAYVRSSSMYGLWRLCSLHAGAVSGDSSWSTLVNYWILRLQELKYQPQSVDGARTSFLSALTNLVKADQPLLAQEMRRQWRLATGESMDAPPPPSPQVIAAATIPHVGHRRRESDSSCEDGHWVEDVSSDGEVVKLEDGSLWRVDDADTVDSALWLPTTDIVVCDGKLINTEDNESVTAERIH